MGFTYQDELTDDRSRVRFEVGDTVAETALFTDAEVDAKLAEHAGNIIKTAADLCDQLATRFARGFDVTTDGQSMKRSQRSAMYAERAAALRGRAAGGGGLSIVQVTRIDGASDNLSARDGARTVPEHDCDDDQPY